jgi:hypothetical protein
MASRSESVLLLGGPSNGSLINGVSEQEQRLDVGGAVYVRTDESGPRLGDQGVPGDDGERVFRTYPIFRVT